MAASPKSEINMVDGRVVRMMVPPNHELKELVWSVESGSVVSVR
jgi:hypothetical protein